MIDRNSSVVILRCGWVKLPLLEYTRRSSWHYLIQLHIRQLLLTSTINPYLLWALSAVLSEQVDACIWVNQDRCDCRDFEADGLMAYYHNAFSRGSFIYSTTAMIATEMLRCYLNETAEDVWSRLEPSEHCLVFVHLACCHIRSSLCSIVHMNA